MKAVKLLLFKSKPEWTSCNTIQDNLVHAYSFKNKCSISYLDSSNDISLLVDLAQALVDRPSIIILLDYRFSPIVFFDYLNSLEDSYNPQVVIHVYGDFILHLNQWKIPAHIFTRFHIKLVVASSAQQKIVAQFFSPTTAISVIPFPVDTSLFKYSAELEKVTEEYTFIYTGRMSLQKNILEVIRTFKTAAEFNSNLRLQLVGNFDDIGMPYTKSFGGKSDYTLRVVKEIESSPNIFYMPTVSQQELNKLYNQASCFISCSTYNDEDFGMSVAESLCVGLPAILTRWGGFNDFLKQGSTYPVKVKRGNSRPLFHEKELLQLFLQADSICSGDRFLRSKQMAQIYSISSVGKKLHNLLLDDVFIVYVNDKRIDNLIFDEFSLAEMKVSYRYNSTYYNLYQGYLDE